jgi:hypothetical protein
MKILLPFQYDERMEKWGENAFPNSDLCDALGDDQYHMVLFVIARKHRSRRKVASLFKIVCGGGGGGGNGASSVDSMNA